MTLPSSQPSAIKDRRSPRQPPGGNDLGKDTSREARRVAAMVLEVLAGTRTTADAASALGIGMTRYYLLETRALHGLVAACEPRTQGRRRSLTADLQALQRDCDRSQREVMRLQALLRAAQRTVGLAPPPATPPKGASRKHRRKPVARALSVAGHLQSTDNGMSAESASTTEGPQQ